MAAAFSAIIIVGELVLPEVIDGNTSALALRGSPRRGSHLRVTG
jgi:hypothetical protein